MSGRQGGRGEGTAHLLSWRCHKLRLTFARREGMLPNSLPRTCIPPRTISEDIRGYPMGKTPRWTYSHHLLLTLPGAGGSTWANPGWDG